MRTRPEVSGERKFISYHFRAIPIATVSVNPVSEPSMADVLSVRLLDTLEVA